MDGILIRSATRRDDNAIWEIVEPMVRAGDTYTLPREMSREDALTYWLSPRHEAFVAEMDGSIVGTYYLRANQEGGGAHVANCGYVTAKTRLDAAWLARCVSTRSKWRGSAAFARCNSTSL